MSGVEEDASLVEVFERNAETVDVSVYGLVTSTSLFFLPYDSTLFEHRTCQ